MSSIQDMNNRMRQNRNLRPSKRSKFREINRETIYTGVNKDDKYTSKEFSEFQIKKTISKIRGDAKSKQRLELIVTIFFCGIVGLFITYHVLTKKNTVRTTISNTSTVNHHMPLPILWSGKLSEPIRVPYSDYFYIPVVGNLDYVDLERTYEISPRNMVVNYTSNIIFLDKNCDILGTLLPKNGSIRYMITIPEDEGFESKKILYRLTQDEPNVYGKIYNLKKHYVYISDIDGRNLTKITDREVRSFQWDNQGREIIFYFFLQ